MKLKTLLDLYTKEKPQLSIRTIYKYQATIKLFIVDAGINDIFITRDECIRWRNKILSRSSAGNCNNYHRHLKSLFNFAVKSDYIDHNVFTSIQLLKNNRCTRKTIDQKTLDKLIETIKTDAYYSQLSWFYLAMIDVLRLTGIRRRQLIGIKWDDIDFENKTLYLDSEFSKNGNDNLLPINATLTYHFTEIKKRTKRPTQFGQVFNITKFVKSYKNDRMTEEHVSRLFAKWSSKIDTLISAHRFRHTAATKIVNNCGNLKAVQQLLGHTNIKTTLGYVETNIDDLRKVQACL